MYSTASTGTAGLMPVVPPVWARFIFIDVGVYLAIANMAVTMRKKWLAVIIGVFAIFLGELYTFSLNTESKAKALRIQMLVFFQLMMALTDYLSWKIIRKVHLVIKVFICTFVALAHNHMLAYFFLVGTHPSWLGILSYLSLGMYLEFNIALLTLAVVIWILRKCGLIYKSDHEPLKENISRKEVKVRKVQVILSAVYALLLGLYGLYNVSKPPLVKHVTITFRGLPKSLDGFRIVQLSDIHLGATVGKIKLERIVRMTNDLKPGI